MREKDILPLLTETGQMPGKGGRRQDTDCMQPVRWSVAIEGEWQLALY